MALIIFSQSRLFEGHINAVIDMNISVRSKLSTENIKPDDVILIHAPSFDEEIVNWFASVAELGAAIGVAADNPRVEDLLRYTQLGARGFCNSLMAKPHYDQLLRLLSNGQSWFPPKLVAETFDLARSAIPSSAAIDPLKDLTKREKDVALAVAEGHSNKLVASSCNMAERTVKAHLTQIFKKLQVKDRVALVIYLNQFDLLKLNRTTTG